MGVHCSALRESALSGCAQAETRGPEAAPAHLDESFAGPAIRAAGLHDPTFSMRDFALGLQIGEIQTLLKVLRADKLVVPEQAARGELPHDQGPALELEPDELVVPVQHVPQIPAVAPDEVLRVGPDLVPAHVTLDSYFSKAFKACEDFRFPRSPTRSFSSFNFAD